MIVVGDRVLVKPDEETRTHSGLFLPQGAAESDGVRSGRVIATGPGVALAPSGTDPDEPWKEPELTEPRYLPMQVHLDDVAIFFKKAAIEVRYKGETYLVVPQSAVLLVIRD